MKRILWSLALLIPLVGCSSPAPSLHALITKEQAKALPGLSGDWTDDENKVNESGGGGCTFEQEKDGGYKLTAGDPEEETSYVFAVRVASLNGRSFVDAILKEMTIRGKRADDDGFMIPVHYFGTIEVDGDQLHIRLLGSDWLKAALKDGRTDLRHEVIEQDPILTAASKDLQDFAFRYAWDQEAFSYTLDFWRRKPTK